MITVSLNEADFEYDIHSLVKAFYPKEDVKVFADSEKIAELEEKETPLFHMEVLFSRAENVISASVLNAEAKTGEPALASMQLQVDFSDRKETKNRLKRGIYQMFSEYTGQTLPWGTLTGIRPTKIPMSMLEEGKSEDEIRTFMADTYFCSPEKTELSIDIAKRELGLLNKLDYEKGYSLYIGIPFLITVPYCGTSVFFLAIFDLPFLITCSFRIYTSFLSESLYLIKDTAGVKRRARHPCLALRPLTKASQRSFFIRKNEQACRIYKYRSRKRKERETQKKESGESGMLNKFHEKQQGMELIILEQLVPQEHLLRKIDRSIDFSFIRRLCAPLYSANLGRPAIEPEVLFRMLFVGYLYGIRSERRLEEEINYNMAYKWFCGLSLTEKAPDATTLSVNRKRRFRDNDIPEQIFNEILRQAMEKGLVGGTILYTDSTHVKAKANKHKKMTVVVERTPKAYLEELDEAIERDRKELGKKPFEKKDDDDPPPTREVQQSKSDPESGQLHKEGKPDGFHYSEHRTVDSKHNIVVNVRITPANVNDVEPIAEILKDFEKRLGKQPRYMGLDAGYHNAPVCHQLAQAVIQPVVGYRRHTHKGDYFGKYRFTYDPIKNVYLCPQGHELTWRTTNREGYREYWSESKTCRDCPKRAKCFSAKSSRRQVTRHVWQDALEQADAFGKTSSGKRIYAWRKETIERSFAEAKELHGLRYARMLGIRNMYEQSFLTAAVQNMKRIARAFRSLFSVLPYAFRGCFPKKAAPLSAV